MSFSVFAGSSDEIVLDGFHVDDVPYSPDFESVLTASDDKYVLYSSSDNKTYKSSSVLSASDTTVEPLYTSKSIVNMIPKNIWRGDNHPSVTFPVLDGFTGVKYVWSNNANPNSFYHTNEAPLLSFFKSERKYRITFTLSIKTKVKGTFNFYLSTRSDVSTPVIPLCSLSYPPSGGGLLTSGSRDYSFDFVVPNGVSSLTPIVNGTVYGTDFEFYINNFTVTDITTEDLDNSLGKFGDRIQGFFNNLIESIKGFFIPQDGFFETVKQNFQSLLSEHLGFLYEAPQMVGTIFNVVKDWNPPEQPTITLPAFDFDIGDDHIHLWDEQVYTFDFLSNQPWSTLYAFYKTFIFVLLSVAMINLAIKKYHSIIGGGESDDN